MKTDLFARVRLVALLAALAIALLPASAEDSSSAYSKSIAVALQPFVESHAHLVRSLW